MLGRYSISQMSLKPKSYKDKVVWITGASSGIGAALASAFAARGATLVLSARRADRLEAVRTGCAHAERHRILPLDLTETAAIPTAADSVLSQQGRVDMLVNNGGITQRSLVRMPVWRWIAVSWKRLFRHRDAYQGGPAIHARTPKRRYHRRQQLVGYFARRSVPRMPRQNTLRGFFDALRTEVYADGLHVILVCPAFPHRVSLHALTADSSPHASIDAVRLGIAPENALPKSWPASTGVKTKSSLAAGNALLLLHRFFPAMFRRAMHTFKVT